MSKIQATYKSKETEETLDIYFYRPAGYILARAAMKLGFTPNAVTIFSMIVGVIAGHLFYYANYLPVIIGIFLLIFYEALDGADGQLARMTNNKSKYGRILDGFAGNIVFLSIYIHLCFRVMEEDGSFLVWALAIIGGLSHSLQSAMADYYRNGYLQFAVSAQKGELETSDSIKQQYNQLSWMHNLYKKFLMRVYLNYTVEQEFISPEFLRLRVIADELFNGVIPDDVSKVYRMQSKSLVKYYNILTTNTRMVVLFIALLIEYVQLYFYFEIFILNILLLYVVLKQESISRKTISELYKQRPMINTAGLN